MELIESIRAGLKELVLPELDRIREENREIKAILQLTNKRLDDISLHLADQSRRIDDTNKRIDDTNKRIDDMNKRIDDTNNRIDQVRSELSAVMEKMNARIDAIPLEFMNMYMQINTRLDSMYQRQAPREEVIVLERRVYTLERSIEKIQERLAA